MCACDICHNIEIVTHDYCHRYQNHYIQYTINFTIMNIIILIYTLKKLFKVAKMVFHVCNRPFPLQIFWLLIVRKVHVTNNDINIMHTLYILSYFSILSCQFSIYSSWLAVFAFCLSLYFSIHRAYRYNIMHKNAKANSSYVKTYTAIII